MSILRDKFVSLAAPVMAATLAFSAPAWAEDNPANSNVPITNASVSIPSDIKETSCEKWQRQSIERQMFPVVCAEDMSESVVTKGAKDSSYNQLMIVVWGGNHELKLEGIKLAHSMNKDGKNVAIAFGPDRDGSELSAQYDLYAMGGQAINSAGNIGIDNIAQVSTVFAPIANDAYEKNFTQKVALNSAINPNLR